MKRMINENLLVSTIIPTFKRDHLLGRAINSVLNQTYQNIEVIVVDDNDPETIFRHSTEKLMSLYANDKRVQYIKHKKNQNGAAARNTGIEHSKGNVLCFLDDDDWFLPTKIEMQLKVLLINRNFQGVYCGRIENATLVTSNLSGDLSEQILLSEFIPGTPTLMIFKECLVNIGGFSVHYRRHQDSELLLRFFKKYKLKGIEEPYLIVGINQAENDIHGNKLEKLKNDFLNDFNETIEEIDKRNKGFKKKVYAKHYVKVFFDHIQNKHFCMAYRILRNYMVHSPYLFSKFSFKHLLGWIRTHFIKKQKYNV